MPGRSLVWWGGTLWAETKPRRLLRSSGKGETGHCVQDLKPAPSEMMGDSGRPGGLCFGTNTGSVLVSENAGDSWQEIARHLPRSFGGRACARGLTA
ncbi:hypothetical protein SAMN05421539_109147 [Jannaschia seohaensis]|uniref:Uncharacterized protein n=1 Tax=Jannaschia seohaensis TaxID=475081 RepID=A0A2Y9AYJ5_9RHOB|nr:hypothetical protein BCF38_109147 [Jannaschia seohaensis]SSA49344.1 hypothetical protein SAMN05421539_109147 [Jannaschia seohaensis]